MHKIFHLANTYIYKPRSLNIKNKYERILTIADFPFPVHSFFSKTPTFSIIILLMFLITYLLNHLNLNQKMPLYFY